MVVSDTKFSRELDTLITKFVADGADPADIATELQRQVNLLIDRHNLEYELLMAPKKRAAA